MTGRRNPDRETTHQHQQPISDAEARVAALDESIARGLADAEAGRVCPADEVFARLEGKYRAVADRLE